MTVTKIDRDEHGRIIDPNATIVSGSCKYLGTRAEPMIDTRSKERRMAEELYAAICNEVGRGGSKVQIQLIEDAIRAAVDEEHEACAKVAESSLSRNAGSDIAKVIRARGD